MKVSPVHSLLPAVLLLAASASAQGPSTQAAAAAAGHFGDPRGTSWEDVSPPWLTQTAPLSIAVKPDDPNWILVTTAHRAVMWTADGGATWFNPYLDFYINDYTPSWWVTDVAFRPTAPNEVIATTLAGTYWSDDAGAHWYPFVSGDAGAALSVEASPDGAKAVVGGLFGSIWVYDWSSRTWAPPVVVNTSAMITGLSFDVDDPAWMYIANTGNPLWTTPDYGVTLHKFNRGLPPGTSQVRCDPVIPGRAHVTSGPELYMTPDGPTWTGGVGWVRTGNGLPGTDIMCLAHHPLDPERMYAGLIDHGVYHSPNRGADWLSLGTRGMNHLRILDVEAGGDGRWLFACGHSGSEWEGGVYRLRIGR